MDRKKFRLITCNALAPMLLPLVGPDTDVEILDIGLHVSPDRLREQVQKTVYAMEEPGLEIRLGYGLCGRGLEGVSSAKSRLILPRVDDCVGALLGSRERHRGVLKESAGTFFMEPSWLDTEMNIFEGNAQGMERFSPAQRRRIIGMALEHYTSIGMLVGPKPEAEALGRCRGYADAYGLEVRQIVTDLSLLQRLAAGPHDPESFVVTPPGMAIPFFQ